MKAIYLSACIGAIAMSGCTVVRPVAYQPVVAPAPVAVAPTVVLQADPAAPSRAGEGMSR